MCDWQIRISGLIIRKGTWFCHRGVVDTTALKKDKPKIDKW